MKKLRGTGINFRKERQFGLKKLNFGQKFTQTVLKDFLSTILSQFWSKVTFFSQKLTILIKSDNLDQFVSKFWSKIKILAKNHNFGQKSHFWQKITIVVKISQFW